MHGFGKSHKVVISQGKYLAKFQAVRGARSKKCLDLSVWVTYVDLMTSKTIPQSWFMSIFHPKLVWAHIIPWHKSVTTKWDTISSAEVWGNVTSVSHMTGYCSTNTCINVIIWESKLGCRTSVWPLAHWFECRKPLVKCSNHDHHLQTIKTC